MTATPHTDPKASASDHQSTDKRPATKEDKIDAQMEDSFPASDPPSFSGGNHIIGAPKGRESQAPTPDDPAVVEAEKKAAQSAKKKT
jgi:hypothetical protein